jgi:hypothetical protein
MSCEQTVSINAQPVNVTITEQPLNLMLGAGGGSGCCPTGVFSTENSTTIPLQAGQIFTGQFEDVTSYASVIINVQYAATGPFGLTITWSGNDGVGPFINQTFTIGTQGFTQEFVPQGRFLLVQLQNLGPDNALEMTLGTTYRVAASVPAGLPGLLGTTAVYVQGIPGGVPQPISGTVTTIPAGGGATQTVIQAPNSSVTVVPSGTQTVAIAGATGTQTVTGTVAVNNFPATQTITGLTTVSNFPVTQTIIPAPLSSITTVPSGTQTVVVAGASATQTVTGTVAVNNFPATQTVAIAGATGTQTVVQALGSSITVANFPATQTVAGTVTSVGGPATQTVIQAPASSITVVPSGTQTVTGTVTGLPSGTQTVIQAPASSVTVANFPATQTVIPAPASSVTIVPSGTQTVAGTVTHIPINSTNTYTNTIAGSATATIGPFQIDQYGVIELQVFTNGFANPNMLLQFSVDNVNWDLVYSYPVNTSTPFYVQLAPPASYFRIIFPNGGTPATIFRLETSLRSVAALPVCHAGQSGNGIPQQAVNVQGTWNATPVSISGSLTNLTNVVNPVTVVGNYSTQTFTTALGANASTTLAAVQVDNLAGIAIDVNTDQSGTLTVQFSVNGSTWLDGTYTYAVTGGTQFSIQLVPISSYFRVIYTNGATPQTTFRLETSAKLHPGIPATNAGTNAQQAIAVQGVTNGVAVPVSGTITSIPSSTGTTTVLPLSATATYTTTMAANAFPLVVPPTLITPYSVIEVYVETDQASNANGLWIQFSVDGVNFVGLNYVYFVAANVPFYQQIVAPTQYYRIAYQNGAAPNTVFHLTSTIKNVAGLPVANAPVLGGSQAVVVQGVGSGQPVIVSGTTTVVPSGTQTVAGTVTGLPSGTQTITGVVGISTAQTITVVSTGMSGNVFPTSWYEAPGIANVPMSTAFTGTSTSNGAVTVTVAAAAPFYAIISGVCWSYSGGTPTGSLIIQVAGTTMFQFDITNNGAGFIPMVPPVRATNTAQNITATLTAGGTSIVGKLNLLGGWTAA